MKGFVRKGFALSVFLLFFSTNSVAQDECYDEECRVNSKEVVNIEGAVAVGAKTAKLKVAFELDITKASLRGETNISVNSKKIKSIDIEMECDWSEDICSNENKLKQYFGYDLREVNSYFMDSTGFNWSALVFAQPAVSKIKVPIASSANAFVRGLTDETVKLLINYYQEYENGKIYITYKGQGIELKVRLVLNKKTQYWEVDESIFFNVEDKYMDLATDDIWGFLAANEDLRDSIVDPLVLANKIKFCEEVPYKIMVIQNDGTVREHTGMATRCHFVTVLN